MMQKLTQINAVRADLFDDCRLVTPLEELKQLVTDIETGKVAAPAQVFVAMLTFYKHPGTPDTYKTRYRCAGATGRELIALLEIAKNDLLNQ